MLQRSGFWMCAGAMAGLFCLTISGCGEVDPATLGEDEHLEVPTDLTLERALSAQPDSDSQPLTADSADKIDAEGPTGDLKFALTVGGRFPLQKTIEQFLTQQTPNGPATSSSALTMLFAISVDAEEAGRKRLGVRYQRVQYRQDIVGEKLEYDSKSPPAEIPDDLLLYHGMVDNGFSFWLSDDNRIVEVIGFQDFLKRCVRYAPQWKQKKLIDGLVTSAEDEGFANFVDDSIGLLPYHREAVGHETEVRQGESWTRERRLLHPMPMTIRTNYRLNQMTDEVAQISIIGTIEPVHVAPVSATGQNSFQDHLALRTGHLVGSCVIDRQTGLPIQSQIERHMKILIGLPGQPAVEQQKSVITSIRSFPTQGTVFSKTPTEPGELLPDVVRTGAEARVVHESDVVNADFEQPQAPRANLSGSAATPQR